MILLDASSHVVYESLRRNFGWGWAEAQKAPWPLRPNLNRTKWSATSARDEPDEDDAGVALSPAAARHAAAAVIAARLLASASGLGYGDDRRDAPLAVGSPGAASLVVCGLRAYCDGGFVGDLNSAALAFAVLLAQALFSGAYIAATAYVTPATPSAWSRAGNLCLFCFMWHRAFLPPLDALADRVQRDTGLDALVLLPLYAAFQAFLSQPFPPLSALRDKVRYRARPAAWVWGPAPPAARLDRRVRRRRGRVPREAVTPKRVT
ncbi:ligase [Aureococcus anophagefferens]|nr:ligase [Aureococcus anophagefferens]